MVPTGGRAKHFSPPPADPLGAREQGAELQAGPGLESGILVRDKGWPKKGLNHWANTHPKHFFKN